MPIERISKITEQEWDDAIVEKQGNITGIAAKLGIATLSVYRYTKENPHIWDKIEQQRQNIRDGLEQEAEARMSKYMKGLKVFDNKEYEVSDNIQYSAVQRIYSLSRKEKMSEQLGEDIKGLGDVLAEGVLMKKKNENTSSNDK